MEKFLRLEMRKSSTQEPLIPRFCKTDVMWCGNFAVIGQLDSVWTVFLVSNILKFSVKFVKSDTNNIQNVKIQFFFRKGFAREFLSAFFCFKKLFFKRNLNQQREFKALNFIFTQRFR